MQEKTMDDLRSSDDGAWLDAMARLGDETGYFRKLGPNHAALFADEGTTLLVTFESMRSIRNGTETHLPLGHAVAKDRKWSHLCLIAQGDTWYRDPAVYAYFDQLVDDAFFEDFERVVFFGAGMAGYAAAAYSVAAPGATVLLVQPQATLDPRVAGWDTRYTEMRRACFTDRYGYAPDMTEGAGPVYVIYDPEQTLDAMHAALFRRPFTTLLRCPNVGRDVSGALMGMHVLPSILAAAGDDTFDAALFHTFYRARRNYMPYLLGLSSKLETDGRPLLNAVLCRNVVERLNGPRFRHRLAQLEKQLDALGLKVPRART
jgi:hypothetical protein